jgi:hypothetical protein
LQTDAPLLLRALAGHPTLEYMVLCRANRWRQRPLIAAAPAQALAAKVAANAAPALHTITVTDSTRRGCKR